MLMTAAATATGLFFLILTLFTAPLFCRIIAFTPGGEEGFIQQAVVDSDPHYYYFSLLRQASAQEQSTSLPNLPFAPFSLQQETVPGGEPGVTELTTASEPPLIAEIITNATQAYTGATIKLDANITGGAPPYSYSWSVPDFGVIDQDRSITQMFFEPGTFTYILTVTDSRGKTVNDGVQIVIRERLSGGAGGGAVAPEPGGTAPPGGGVPLTVEIIPNATQGFAPATFQFNSKVTGGTEPYYYEWKLAFRNPIFSGAQLVAVFNIAGTYTVILNVTDSTGRTGSDTVEITVGGLSELPPSDLGEVVTPPEGGGVLPPPETGQEGQPPGALLQGTVPPSNDTDTGQLVSPPETGQEGQPPLSDDTGEEEQGGTPPPSSTTEEQEEVPSPDDDTGGEG